MIEQRGSFVLGLVVGLLVGLSLALGVALYITKAPIPFVNKVPPRTAEQDKAEAERNKNWDPNAPLGARGTGKPGISAAPTVVPASTALPTAPAMQAAAASAAAPRSNRDAAALLAGSAASAPRSTTSGVDPFVYFVQVGAYSNADEAEQQRGKLAMSGLTAKITEREQAGRTIYRVRLGPYNRKDDADALQIRLTESSIDARLVRVERN